MWKEKLILDIIMKELIGGSMIASCQCYNVTCMFDIRWYGNMLMNNKNCSYLSPYDIIERIGIISSMIFFFYCGKKYGTERLDFDIL